MQGGILPFQGQKAIANAPQPSPRGVAVLQAVRHRMQTLPPLQPGTLYLVATPIGNLEDITHRAVRTLRECDLVAAEDTRHTGQLLKHLGISKPLISCFQHSETRRAPEMIERLRSGGTIAYVTDAGTPGVSDPGERLVRMILEAGLRVESVPGPCAALAALTASGLPTAQFHFTGFLPRKSGARRNQLSRLAAVPGTLVFYESPHRVEKLLVDLAALWPATPVVLARELTKKFEQYLRGTADQLRQQLAAGTVRGEFVVLVGEPRANSSLPAEADAEDAAQLDRD